MMIVAIDEEDEDGLALPWSGGASEEGEGGRGEEGMVMVDDGEVREGVEEV